MSQYEEHVKADFQLAIRNHNFNFTAEAGQSWHNFIIINAIVIDGQSALHFLRFKIITFLIIVLIILIIFLLKIVFGFLKVLLGSNEKCVCFASFWDSYKIMQVDKKMPYL